MPAAPQLIGFDRARDDHDDHSLIPKLQLEKIATRSDTTKLAWVADPDDHPDRRKDTCRSARRPPPARGCALPALPRPPPTDASVLSLKGAMIVQFWRDEPIGNPASDYDRYDARARVVLFY